LKSIFSNTVNYFIFKLGRDDAERIVHNLNLEVQDIFLRSGDKTKEEVAMKMIADLNVGECIIRLMKDQTYLKPAKVRILMNQGV
jgi:hypothetical protein